LNAMTWSRIEPEGTFETVPSVRSVEASLLAGGEARLRGFVAAPRGVAAALLRFLGAPPAGSAACLSLVGAVIIIRGRNGRDDIVLQSRKNCLGTGNGNERGPACRVADAPGSGS